MLKSFVFWFSLFAFFSGSSLFAAKVGELVSLDAGEQLIRFLMLKDRAVKYTLLGAVFMGLSTGFLGSFLVVRRLSMMGDTLSHAVLPGLVAGFLWAQGKDPWVLFMGAFLSGLLGVWMVSLIQKTTILKQDVALGVVLSGFYAIGIALLSRVQRLQIGQTAGLDKVLFGQAAALSDIDLLMMAGALFLTFFFGYLFYKEWVLLSFDRGFAKSLGLSFGLLEGVFIAVLTATIVSSLKSSGAVLISAMLIIPASTGSLLTQRFQKLWLLSIGFSLVACIGGALISFLRPGLPTGPCMVLVAAGEFLLALIFSPTRGLLIRQVRQIRLRRRIELENTLKAIYHVLEEGAFRDTSIALTALAEKRRQSLELTSADIDKLAFLKWVYWKNDKHQLDEARLELTESGWARACEVIRNHRLWELYLTHAANYAPDHVHDDAEKIEHLLGENIVRQIESRLNYPRKDPHGKLIPSLADLDNPHFTRSPWGRAEHKQ